MKGLKVQCPNCKKVMHETTDAYDPDIPPNGSMVQLVEPYKHNNWPIFGDGVMVGTKATKRAEMDCPSCLAQLAPSGHLTVIQPIVVDDELDSAESEAEVEVLPDETPIIKKSKAKGKGA